MYFHSKDKCNNLVSSRQTKHNLFIHTMLVSVLYAQFLANINGTVKFTVLLDKEVVELFIYGACL